MKKGDSDVTSKALSVSEDQKRQTEYGAKLQAEGFDFSLVVAGAFARGMRDVGYKHTGTALDELIDNAIQAEANQIWVHFGYENGDDQEKEPRQLAVVDNGHGMDPLMIRAAVLWGGTHRENDRSGFGRYGYGLPSSCVSIGRRFTVYSKNDGAEWYQVTIDLDEIGQGTYNDGKGKPVAPTAVREVPPRWLPEQMRSLSHGTIVVINKVDRLTYRYAKKLQQYLLEHFGLVYRNYLGLIRLTLNGVRVEPLDPLFITEEYRYYDEDSDRAEALPPMTIKVKAPDGSDQLGTIKVRFSYMSPTFLRKPEYKKNPGGGKTANNNRFHVRRENNGIIVLRKGRQIDVVKPEWTVFQNYDRNIGIELDFDPILDEYFRITTSKQQIVVDDRLWDILKKEGFNYAVEHLRGRYRKAAKDFQTTPPAGSEELPSEVAMRELEKFRSHKPKTATPEQEEEGQKNLDQEAERIGEQTNTPKEEVRKKLEEEASKRPYKVEKEDHPDGAFYRVAQIGGQKVLYINTAHRFFGEVYAIPGQDSRMQRALELLLFVRGQRELEATGDWRIYYRKERMIWSDDLETGLDLLGQQPINDDEEAASDEALQTGAGYIGPGCKVE